MGKKQLTVPGLSISRSNLMAGEWWEGVRGSVRYLGDRIPKKLSELSLAPPSSQPHHHPNPPTHDDTDDDPVLLRRLHQSESSAPDSDQQRRFIVRRRASRASSVDDVVITSPSAEPLSPSNNNGSHSTSAALSSSSTSRSKSRNRLSALFPRGCERLESTVRTVRKDLVRLRSKSCDRLLRRRKDHHHRRSSPVVDVDSEATEGVAAAAEYNAAYFELSSTLRRSRRVVVEERRRQVAAAYQGPYMGYARARVTCVPSPYDTEALKFKVGDLIHVIRKNPSGIWEGECQGRVGKFKFINVEVVEEMPVPAATTTTTSSSSSSSRPASSIDDQLAAAVGEITSATDIRGVVERTAEGSRRPTVNPTSRDNETPESCSGSRSERDGKEAVGGKGGVTGLLVQLQLSHLTSRLVLHGWDSLDRLEQLTRTDLDYLGIQDRTEQDKLLTVVTVIQEIRRNEERDANMVRNGGRKSTPARSSGCSEGGYHRRMAVDRNCVARMDSGYYDTRDEDGASSCLSADEMDGKSSTSSHSSSSADSYDSIDRLLLTINKDDRVVSSDSADSSLIVLRNPGQPRNHNHHHHRQMASTTALASSSVAVSRPPQRNSLDTCRDYTAKFALNRAVFESTEGGRASARLSGGSSPGSPGVGGWSSASPSASSTPTTNAKFNSTLEARLCTPELRENSLDSRVNSPDSRVNSPDSRLSIADPTSHLNKSF